jgi:hypothetical protein
MKAGASVQAMRFLLDTTLFQIWCAQTRARERR